MITKITENFIFCDSANDIFISSFYQKFKLFYWGVITNLNYFWYIKIVNNIIKLKRGKKANGQC